MHSSVISIAFLLALSGIPAAAGITLIAQQNVLAGKVTPGDAPGFPVTITQPGSYRLAGNLTVPDASTTAMEIAAGNVTIDLNGFSILGPNICTPSPTRCTSPGAGVGIVAVGAPGVLSPSHIRVFNGFIRGMGSHGIRMLGDHNVVERVHSLMNGGPGIMVPQGSVIDSVARLNGGGTAIAAWMVRGSMAIANSNIGIVVHSGGVASGNVSVYNDGSGMRADFSTLTGNTVNENGGFGVESLCPGVLDGNTATRNRNANIATNGACVLTGNSQQ